MDKKLDEATNLCVEIMSRRRRQRGELVTWYKFAFAV